MSQSLKTTIRCAKETSLITGAIQIEFRVMNWYSFTVSADEWKIAMQFTLNLSLVNS